MKYIDHLSKRGADFLHPGSKKSTDFFIQQILKNKPNSVLEIGCGTGATLISLASNNINNLIGIDINSNQIEMAKKRIIYCGLDDSIQVQLISNSAKLPFEDNSFDVALAESVLGILEHQHLIYLMSEVKRILKPNGLFLSNDVIWKENVTFDVTERINQRALRNFGLIQSSGHLIGSKKWSSFFNSGGFNSVKIFDVDNLPESKIDSLNFLETKSKEFTNKHKQKSLFNLTQIYHEISYKLKEFGFNKNEELNLENKIFVMNS